MFYWYQAEPAGYRHEPLPPLAARRVAMLHPRNLNWFPTETVNPGSRPADENWQTRTYALTPYVGKTVCLAVKVAYGGPFGVCNEEAFFDEMSVIAQTP